jgi:hypothetical protein
MSSSCGLYGDVIGCEDLFQLGKTRARVRVIRARYGSNLFGHLKS